MYWYGSEGKYNVMVIDLLGPNLEQLLEHCGGKFSLKTTVMIGEQIVTIC